MAINPNRSVGQPIETTAAAAPNTTSDVPKSAVKVTASDSLVIAVKKGDTLFQLARVFAEDANGDQVIAGKELTGYVKNLKQANGGDPSMAIDSPLKVPVKDGAYKVQLGIAVQKWLDQNPQAGKGTTADYAWRDLSWRGGPVDAAIVTVPKRDGTTEQFMVWDDQSAEGDEAPTGDFAVQTFADAIKELERY